MRAIVILLAMVSVARADFLTAFPPADPENWTHIIVNAQQVAEKSDYAADHFQFNRGTFIPKTGRHDSNRVVDREYLNIDSHNGVAEVWHRKGALSQFGYQFTDFWMEDKELAVTWFFYETPAIPDQDIREFRNVDTLFLHILDAPGVTTRFDYAILAPYDPLLPSVTVFDAAHYRIPKSDYVSPVDFDLVEWGDGLGNRYSGSDFLLWQRDHAAASVGGVPEPSIAEWLILFSTGVLVYKIRRELDDRWIV